MGKSLIVHCTVPAFKEWPTNFKLLFQALNTYTHNSIFSISSVLSMRKVRGCSNVSIHLYIIQMDAYVIQMDAYVTTSPHLPH